MPVAEELHGGGEVDCLVKVAEAAGGGLAGGQERQVPSPGGLGGEVGDVERTVPEDKSAAVRGGMLLACMAGQVYP